MKKELKTNHCWITGVGMQLQYGVGSQLCDNGAAPSGDVWKRKRHPGGITMLVTCEIGG